MEYPRMKWEILDAIKEYYDKDTDILVDCLRYLKGTSRDGEMRAECFDNMISLGYCPECGERLESYQYVENHPELDGGIVDEDMYGLRCRECRWVYE